MNRTALLLTLVVALAACGPGIKITQDVNEKVDRELVTYGFLKDSDDLTDDQRVRNRRVKDLLRVQLNAKGYQQVSTQPDFIVGQFAASVFSLEEVEDAGDLAKRLEQQKLMSGDRQINIDQSFNFEDARLKGHGTLLVFMTDSATGNVFWRSRAEADLSFEGQGAEKVNEAVKLIMQGFPARQVSPAP